MSTTPSRRSLIDLGAGVLAAALVPQAASAKTPAGATTRNETIVRRWYGLWETEKQNWAPFAALLADDFTFTSAAPDDHISKAAFKTTCWDTQIGHIKSFDLELAMAQGDAVFVRYLCHTTNGKAFRNVELLRLRRSRIASIECYFGGPAGYPTAAESQKK